MKDYSVILPCGEATMIVIHDAFDKGYQQGYEAGKAATPFTDTKEAEKKAYERGLNEAWEAAKKIVEMGEYDRKWIVFTKCDDGEYPFVKYTASEAVAKIKEYEDKQKQDAEIKVGDEIVCEDAYVVVTYVSPNGDWNGFLLRGQDSGKPGQGYTCMKGFNGWRKTGRHFPQIAEVLAELRGAE